MRLSCKIDLRPQENTVKTKSAAVKPARTKDFDIRAAVVRQLLAEGVPRSDIRHEITLDTSSSGGRADLVVILRDKLYGVELKSGSDKLDRLKEQHEAQELAFDGSFVVSDVRHREEIENGPCRYDYISHDPATGRFYRWSRGDQGSITEMMLHYSKSYHTSVNFMARTLWCEETVKIVAKLCGSGCKTRCGSLEIIKERVALRDLRPLVIAALRSRVLSRWEEAFWKRLEAMPRIAGADRGHPTP